MTLIEIENCVAGYILKGHKNHQNNGHFIIFIEHLSFNDFIGAMISSKDFHNKNILMSENHFKKEFDDGSNCKIQFNNSHLVPAKLHKYYDMGPFELYGVLTNAGLNFVLKNIQHLDLEYWDQYLDKK